MMRRRRIVVRKPRRFARAGEHQAPDIPEAARAMLSATLDPLGVVLDVPLLNDVRAGETAIATVESSQRVDGDVVTATGQLSSTGSTSWRCCVSLTRDPQRARSMVETACEASGTTTR